MGLFNKKIETPKNAIKVADKNMEKLKAELVKAELAKKEAEKAKATEDAEKEKVRLEKLAKKDQKEQMHDNEEVDFIEDEPLENNDEVLISEISKMLEKKGMEATLNYIDSIKNQLIIGIMTNQETEEEEEAPEPIDENELPEFAED